MTYVWYVSYYLYHYYAVSLTTLSVQLHIHATNSMEKCVHRNIVVKIKNKIFSALSWDGLY